MDGYKEIADSFYLPAKEVLCTQYVLKKIETELIYVLITFLYLWRNDMAKETYRRNSLMGS